MQLRPYLTFQGECNEAIELYKRAFQTKVDQIMFFGDMPPSPDMPPIPEEMKKQVIQATMTIGNDFIRLSDCMDKLNAPESERISIAVECTAAEVKHAFAILSEEGRVGIPLQETFFSPCHGVVFDKFGVMWNFVAQKS